MTTAHQQPTHDHAGHTCCHGPPCPRAPPPTQACNGLVYRNENACSVLVGNMETARGGEKTFPSSRQVQSPGHAAHSTITAAMLGAWHPNNLSSNCTDWMQIIPSSHRREELYCLPTKCPPENDPRNAAQRAVSCSIWPTGGRPLRRVSRCST